MLDASFIGFYDPPLIPLISPSIFPFVPGDFPNCQLISCYNVIRQDSSEPTTVLCSKDIEASVITDIHLITKLDRFRVIKIEAF